MATRKYSMTYFTIVNTRLGYVGLSKSNVGLMSVTLPQSSRERALAGINGLSDSVEENASAFTDLALQIKRYYDGEKVVFSGKLDFSGATSFNRAVWEATSSIPYGEVRSYSWIAQQIGRPKAYRAVGSALGQNRLPLIIPCHRVIASNGKLGGFGGGLELKKQLLQLEGIKL